MIKKVHVKKDDIVVVISGKDKGKKGKVLSAFPKEGKITVEGVNIRTMHKKPKSANEQGGRIEQESSIYASKVMPFCEKCNKGVRIAQKIDGDKKVRVCAKCGTKLG